MDDDDLDTLSEIDNMAEKIATQEWTRRQVELEGVRAELRQLSATGTWHERGRFAGEFAVYRLTTLANLVAVVAVVALMVSGVLIALYLTRGVETTITLDGPGTIAVLTNIAGVIVAIITLRRTANQRRVIAEELARHRVREEAIQVLLDQARIELAESEKKHGE